MTERDDDDRSSGGIRLSAYQLVLVVVVTLGLGASGHRGWEGFGLGGGDSVRDVVESSQQAQDSRRDVREAEQERRLELESTLIAKNARDIEFLTDDFRRERADRIACTTDSASREDVTEISQRMDTLIALLERRIELIERRLDQ
jgi:hypothetical protein